LGGPFADVPGRSEDPGPDRYGITDNELAVVGALSGDAISLGDAVTVTIEDVAILRRAVYARRVPPDDALTPGRRGRGRGRGRGKQAAAAAGAAAAGAATAGAATACPSLVGRGVSKPRAERGRS